MIRDADGKPVDVKKDAEKEYEKKPEKEIEKAVPEITKRRDFDMDM